MDEALVKPIQNTVDCKLRGLNPIGDELVTPEEKTSKTSVYYTSKRNTPT